MQLLSVLLNAFWHVYTVIEPLPNILIPCSLSTISPIPPLPSPMATTYVLCVYESRKSFFLIYIVETDKILQIKEIMKCYVHIISGVTFKE